MTRTLEAPIHATEINGQLVRFYTRMQTPTISYQEVGSFYKVRPEFSLARRGNDENFPVFPHLLPLDVMLARMRCEPLANGDFVTDEQFEAACAAAPYIHPKLSAVAVKDDRPNAAQLDLSRLNLEELQLLNR